MDGLKRKILLFIVFLSFSAVFLLGQNQVPKKVEHREDFMEYDQSIAGGAYRLIGNVLFKHEGALMYCDSAYFYADVNSLDAFSHVHIIQGDSVDLYGEFLHYDGNTRLAEIKKKVKLIGKNTKLLTKALDFDLGKSIGYYKSHADIESGENRLKSRQGYYYSREQMYYFRDSVVLTNPEYTIYSDTLQYKVPTKVAYFFGPTKIVGDSSYIYCEKGWYNTSNNTSMLRQKAFIRNRRQTITGDSLYYERETGYGEGFSRIVLKDEEKDVILKGNHAFINQVDKKALLTDSAEFIYITAEDSVFIHADTLRSMNDSAGFRILKGYHNVRMFKSDLQGVCDSLFYSTKDSILRLFRKPVLWSGGNQMSSEYIEIWTKNKEIDQLHMQQVAFLINQEDSSKFNQIKGKTMTCFFKNNQLYRIDVNGNGQTVYYAKDKEALIGVNVAQSSDMVITVKNNKPDVIRFITKPAATLYPVAMAPVEELILKDFKWEEEARPKSKTDIFRNVNTHLH
jgi:lipopolysaccharide export system protein LptA